MAVQKDDERARMRALMADPKHGLPEYSEDSNTTDRVGGVIGESAGHGERSVRASDGGSRSTDKNLDEGRTGGPNVRLWSLSIFVGVVALLMGLAYWRLG